MNMEKLYDQVDVLIVGGGAAGTIAAIQSRACWCVYRNR
jgi:succinate dehydrogenase/fumarate reductase flavoprotein subunit